MNLKKFRFLEITTWRWVSLKGGRGFHITSHTSEATPVDTAELPLRQPDHGPPPKHCTDCWESTQGLWCCTAHMGKNKHCSSGSTTL